MSILKSGYFWIRNMLSFDSTIYLKKWLNIVYFGAFHKKII